MFNFHFCFYLFYNKYILLLNKKNHFQKIYFIIYNCSLNITNRVTKHIVSIKIINRFCCLFLLSLTWLLKSLYWYCTISLLISSYCFLWFYCLKAFQSHLVENNLQYEQSHFACLFTVFFESFGFLVVEVQLLIINSMFLLTSHFMKVHKIVIFSKTSVMRIQVEEV